MSLSPLFFVHFAKAFYLVKMHKKAAQNLIFFVQNYQNKKYFCKKLPKIYVIFCALCIFTNTLFCSILVSTNKTKPRNKGGKEDTMKNTITNRAVRRTYTVIVTNDFGAKNGNVVYFKDFATAAAYAKRAVDRFKAYGVQGSVSVVTDVSTEDKNGRWTSNDSHHFSYSTKYSKPRAAWVHVVPQGGCCCRIY